MIKVVDVTPVRFSEDIKMPVFGEVTLTKKGGKIISDKIVFNKYEDDFNFNFLKNRYLFTRKYSKNKYLHNQLGKGTFLIKNEIDVSALNEFPDFEAKIKTARFGYLKYNFDEYKQFMIKHLEFIGYYFGFKWEEFYNPTYSSEEEFIKYFVDSTEEMKKEKNLILEFEVKKIMRLYRQAKIRDLKSVQNNYTRYAKKILIDSEGEGILYEDGKFRENSPVNVRSIFIDYKDRERIHKIADNHLDVKVGDMMMGDYTPPRIRMCIAEIIKDAKFFVMKDEIK